MWVEVLSRHHDVLARHRVDSGEARIGRAYDNDIVLDDPEVAPHHLLVFRADDGTLIAEDLATANGLFDDRGTRVVHAALDGVRPIRIGRTLLRVRDAGFPVAPERPAIAARRHGRAVALLAILVGIVAPVDLWLAQTTAWHAASWLGPLLIYAAAIAAWASAWSLLSRLFSGAARFTTHLAIALAAMLALTLYDWATDAAAYALAWRSVVDYGFAGLWAMLGGTVFLHLIAIARRHARAKAAAITAAVLVAVAAHTVFLAEAERQVGQRAQMARLLPPMLRWSAPQSADAFFGDVDRLRTSLDRAREEEPAAERSPLGGSDD
jgi:hypothetical protein